MEGTWMEKRDDFGGIGYSSNNGLRARRIRCKLRWRRKGRKCKGKCGSIGGRGGGGRLRGTEGGELPIGEL
jgi:hypothetical protein